MAAIALDFFEDQFAPYTTLYNPGQTTASITLFFEQVRDAEAQQESVDALNRHEDVARAELTPGSDRLVSIEFWSRYVSVGEIVAIANTPGVVAKQLS